MKGELMQREPDKLDLKIAEMEAEVTSEIRRLIVQECLGRCKISHPGCPYLTSSEICLVLQNTLDIEVPNILQEMSKKN